MLSDNERISSEIGSSLKSVAMAQAQYRFVTCYICFSEYIPEQTSTIGKCQHRFCYDCLFSHISTAVNSLTMPICPDYDCQTPLDTSSPLFFSLPAALQNKITKISKYYKNLSNPDYKACQTPNCSGSVNSATLMCDQCSTKHCGNCFELKHEGQCEVKVALQLQMTKKYRQCGKCGQVIEKTEGCTHMTCTCGNYFCYSCGQPLVGVHQCKAPSHLSAMQDVRWQIQHLEFWYENSSCTLLRILLLFSPPTSMSTVPRILWILFFTLTFYPLLVFSALTISLASAGTILALALCLSVLLPFIALCNLELFPTEQLRQSCGCCITLLLIIIFYPIFYIVDIIQIIAQILSEEGADIFRPFIDLAQGVKLVLLFPCLMTIDNEQIYLSAAKMRDNQHHFINDRPPRDNHWDQYD